MPAGPLTLLRSEKAPTWMVHVGADDSRWGSRCIWHACRTLAAK
jgi:hypothetical protein